MNFCLSDRVYKRYHLEHLGIIGVPRLQNLVEKAACLVVNQSERGI